MAGFRLVVAIGATVVAVVTATAVVFAAQLMAPDRATPAASAAAPVPPSASSVAGQLAGVTNAHATLTGEGGRIGHVSCIAAAPGAYACSYVRTIPGNGGVCAVALLRWTPDTADTFTVQTSGQVALPAAQCGPVKKVMHVLGTSG
jgi:hypothetical protein